MTPATAQYQSNHDTLAAEVRRQQQILLVRQVPLMMLVNVVNGALVTAVMFARVSLWVLATWLAVTLAFSFIQLAVWLRLRNRPPPPRVSGRSLKRAELWSGIIGLLWGSTVVLFYTGESVPHQMFLAVVIVGQATGTVSLLQPIPRVCGWYVTMILTPLIAVNVWRGGEIHLAVAAMAILFFVGLMNSSRASYRRLAAHVESSLELERAQSNLVDAIESINDAFAIYDNIGRVKLTNQRFRSWFGERRNLADVPGTGGLYRMPGGAWILGSVRPTMQGGYVSVHTDVSELKERERDLVTAKQQAEEASQAKSEFLANMSHELRTPLNAIMGFAQLMRKGTFGPLGCDKYRQYVDDIHGSASHLLAIINEILNLTKIESADYDLSFEKVDVSELIKWVISVCTHQLNNTEAPKINTRVDEDFGLIRADPRALKQVLFNLVNNAVKFTPPSGRVDVEAYIENSGRPCISVSDTGIGIPKRDIQAVRQPFKQVEGAFQRKFRGTGLGLSISEALIRLHGGELKVDSEIGRGTQALILLPAELRELEPGTARAS